MRVIYDIGDEIADDGYPDQSGKVKSFWCFGGDVRYVVENDKGEEFQLMSPFTSPVMVKGLHEKCPKCGTEYGIRRPEQQVVSDGPGTDGIN